jgi:hypothetical protein
MKQILALVIFSLSMSAHAGVKLSGSLKSEYVGGFGRITLKQATRNRLWVHHDQNSCSPDGRTCTEVGYIPFVVNPTIVRDNRPRDGNLYLRLNEKLLLVLAGGMRADAAEYYILTDDSEAARQIRLRPVIDLTLTR